MPSAARGQCGEAARGGARPFGAPPLRVFARAAEQAGEGRGGGGAGGKGSGSPQPNPGGGGIGEGTEG